MLGQVLVVAEGILLVMVASLVSQGLWFTCGPSGVCMELYEQSMSVCSLAAVAKRQEETLHPSLWSLSCL